MHNYIFDPGNTTTISSDLYYFGDEDLFCELSLWVLGTDKPLSFINGVLSVGASVVKLNNILFDTGALHRSYIHSGLVDKHRSDWSNFIHPRSSRIRLGDQKTIVESKEEVDGTIAFKSTTGDVYSSKITLVSHDMPGMDMIVGLPDISRSFVPLLTEMLQQDALQSESLPSIYMLDASLQQMEEPPIGYSTWSNENAEECEEELGTVEPSSFGPVLTFLETSYEDSIKEYHDMLPKHIGPLLVNNKKIWKLLRSDLALGVFCPKEWKGIKGIQPIKIKFKDGFPSSMKVKARPINPKLFNHVKSEITRLLGYMYVKDTSQWASPLVVAAKATPPYIRLCGDYRKINEWIELLQVYVPDIMKEILKAAEYKFKMDMDATNAFHQLILDLETSLRLALMTPEGLIRPKFLPEGVKIASGCLQDAVREVFKDCLDWMIVIFDNFLILANTEEEAVERLEIVLNICKERNVVLKLGKTWIGFETVKFFGYKISYNKYEMDEERKEAITKFLMPKTTKEMQRFLGTALFFKSFIENFSEKSHLLHDMTKSKFNWDPTTWTKDYVSAFEKLKLELANSIAVHFPDYNLKWTLRVDASDVAVGAVLFQERVQDDMLVVNEIIGVASKKFTEIAGRWDPFKKEGYAMYYGVQFFSYFLRGKAFILETDHRNLLWIEKSEVPIVIRWRVYLQSFTIWIKHIPGTKNVVADFLSRMYCMDHEDTMYTASEQHYTHAALLVNMLILDNISQQEETINQAERLSADELISRVHGGRNLHKGSRRTWQALNRFFPGHKISFKKVTEYVESCAICQKDRLGMVDTLKPVVRHIKPEHQRARVGVDRLTITPKDVYGNDTAIVVVEHFTKFVAVYPESEYDGVSVAKSLLRFFASYGLFEELISDPGSDIMSKVVQNLNKWLGIRHAVSLVDWHQSNGVERTNQELLRHLKTLTHDERIIGRWSDPMVLSFIVFCLNDSVNSETGCRPFDLKFGSEDGPYLQLPKTDNLKEVSEKWLQSVNEDLKTVREISTKYQATIIAERLALTPEKYQNKFQPGDMVLFQLDPNKQKPSKLASPYQGPFKVKSQYKNDVEVQHMSTGAIHKFHVTRLKLFVGSEDEAKRVAQLDGDQFVIRIIHNWMGDQMKRTTMSFKVEFEDGDIVWLPYSKDLDGSIPFGNYITTVPMLLPLRYNSKDYNKLVKEWKGKALEVTIGEYFYMDIRYYTVEWYDQLSLPDKYDKTYVVRCNYEGYKDKNKRLVYVRVVIFDERLRPWDYLYTKMYGGYGDTMREGFVEITLDLVRRYPELSPKH